MRPKNRSGVDCVVPEVVHRVVVEGVPLGRRRVIPDEIRRLLDLAERLEPVLPDLDRHQPAVDHLSLADQLRRLAEDLESPLPAEREPARLRPPRGSNRIADVLTGARREMAEDDVVVDRRADGELAVAHALTAVDQVQMVAVELRLRLGQAGLVLAMELLVVGAECRVGDLETRLRLGRHRSESSGRAGSGRLRSV